MNKKARDPAIEKSVDIGEPPALPPEILLMVARHLHFVGLVSASRASKRLRVSLFGSDGPARDYLKDLYEPSCLGSKRGAAGCVGCRYARYVRSI